MQELQSTGQNRERLKESVSGLLVIHSAPAALRPHIEWGLQSILGNWLILNWLEQPLTAGSYRTTVEFRDKRGSAAKIASALRGWHYLRFEVREESELGGEFFRCTPDLGIHRAGIDGMGNIVVTEHQIMDALAKGLLDVGGGFGGGSGCNLKSVAGFLNRALTPMGKRRVQECIVSPTFSETKLEKEYTMIETMLISGLCIPNK